MKINKNEEKWDKNYTLLFTRLNAKMKYPSVYSKNLEEKSLGEWVHNQRRAYSRNKLNKDRISRLESISEWSWSPDCIKWDVSYERLFSRLKEGRGYPNTYSKNKEEANCGQWVSLQRTFYKKSKLNSDRIKKLMLLPQWSWNNQEDKWEINYRRVIKRLNDGLIYPQRNPKNREESIVGAWVNTQRTKYKQNLLRSDRIKKLEALTNWTWNVIEDKWDSKYNELKKAEQLAEVERLHSGKGFNSKDQSFGQWVCNQRVNYHKGKLKSDRIKKLEALPNWSWGIYKDSWQSNLMSLLDRLTSGLGYPKLNPHNKEEYRLKTWLYVQKMSYKKGKLNSNRIKKLEALPNWSW